MCIQNYERFRANAMNFKKTLHVYMHSTQPLWIRMKNSLKVEYRLGTEKRPQRMVFKLIIAKKKNKKNNKKKTTKKLLTL